MRIEGIEVKHQGVAIIELKSIMMTLQMKKREVLSINISNFSIPMKIVASLSKYWQDVLANQVGG